MIGLFWGCLESFKSYNQMFYNHRVLYNKLEFARDHSIAEFIRKNTNYYDAVYSPDYEIVCEPMSIQDLAISRKKIYKILSLDEIPIKDLPNCAVINILISENSIESRKWDKLHKAKIFSRELENFYLFKFSKESFQSLISLK
jgi:PP-loop superfamily ATP-utilizing enzyme